MNWMMKSALGALSLATLVTQASAADLAARPYTKAPPMIAAVYDWSGFYIGANGGYGSTHKCWSQTTGFAPGVFEGCHDATGGVAGGQIGYRWQTGGWVLGLEAQGDWADLNGSNASTVFGVINRTRLDAFGLFTGQIGYAWNNALLYVKGGAAVTRDQLQRLRYRDRRRVRSRLRDPLGRHGRRRLRIRLRPELVGRRRIRPSVHGRT